MERRTFLSSIVGSLLAMPLAAQTQQAGKAWRIGYLAAGPRPPDGAPPAALRQALQELGYVDGQTLPMRVDGLKEGVNGCPSWPPSWSRQRSTWR